jgi:hypothetical protein
VEQDGVSSRVYFDIFQKALDGNIRIVGWNRLLGFILFQVEMGSDGEDGERAVVFVMRRVLRSIDFEEIVGFIGIHSGAGDADVRLLSHVISLCGNKLERTF